MAELRVARSELILGAQNSGKTARAESLAAAWLAQSPGHRAVYVGTAQAWDEEMRERIAQHRRAGRVPRMAAVEEPLEVAHAIGRHSRADTLIVVDCLTLWLTARLVPAVPHVGAQPLAQDAIPLTGGSATFDDALRACAGPMVLISNEIGPDAAPTGQNARAFLASLGGLNQEAASACERVTLMSVGLPMMLKGAA